MKTKILRFIVLFALVSAKYSIGQVFTDVTSSSNLPNPPNMDYWNVQGYDFNNDNIVDIVYPLSGDSIYHFFVNNGNGTFTDITNSSGLHVSKNATIKFADINKDGSTDIVVVLDSSGYSIIHVYTQNSPNLFSNVTSNLNIPNPVAGTFQSLMDYNVDGIIDFIISTRTMGDRSYKALKGRNQGGNILYDTLTTVITLDSVLQNTEIPNVFVSADFDNDGDEDMVYQRFCGTCGILGDGNFYGHTYGYLRNDGNGSFVETSGINGLGKFPRWPIVWDYNDDGKFDLLSGSSDNVSNMQGSRIFVWAGNGNGTFTDVTATTHLYDGVSRYYRVFDVCDFNNDGFQDVYSEIDGGTNADYKLFENNNGLSFPNVASAYGLNFNTSFLAGSHVWFDYDNDGDLDLFANLNGTLKVMKNNIVGKNWLKLRLYGCATNTDAYGVRVEVKFSGKTVVLTPKQGSQLMSSDLHIGLDTSTIIDTLAVYWHLSSPLYLTNVSSNQKLNLYEIQNGNCWSCTNVTTIYNYVNITTYDTTYIAVTDTLVINAQLTGVPTPNNINTLKIFPNPTSTHIYIDNGNYASMSGYTLEIKNILGSTMFSSLISQQQFYIDLSTWTGNGTYFVRIYDNTGGLVNTKKLIIQ